MRTFVSAAVFSVLVLAAQPAAISQQSDSSSQSQQSSTSANAQITLPAGTKVVLALTSPVWAKSAKPGDSIYSATAFPVVAGNEMAIPPGTYVEGKIDALSKPSLFSSHAEFQLHFTKLIFGNGYTVELPDVADTSSSSGSQGGPGAAPNIEVAVAHVYVDVSSRSDLLLDNGTQIEMILQTPLSLDAKSVANAARHSQVPQTGPVKSATRCVPVPPSPGTPDTVIPGTPGSPGTPDTVIPGAPGMPPTVIPGTPATPGTPPTIIPGSPGFAGVACPGPPVVVSKPAGQDIHTKSFQLSSALQVAGVLLPAGKYQVMWVGIGPTTEVDIVQNKKVVVHLQARVVELEEKARADEWSTRANPDGSVSLTELRFAGESFELVFN